MRLRSVRRLPLVAVVLTAAVSFPLGVLASHSFSDVPNSNPFHADIEALKNSGVTSGCGGGKFCPGEFVTREQMAAFMNRLGALGPGKEPVVNADKVDGKDEVMGIGDVVIHQRGPWVPSSPGPDETLTNDPAYTVYHVTNSGSPAMMLFLDWPSQIAGVTYGIKSLRVCLDTATGQINQTRIFETVGTTNGLILMDDTVREAASPHCYTVTDATPQAPTGAPWVALGMVLDAGEFIRVGAVTVTWTPVS